MYICSPDRRPEIRFRVEGGIFCVESVVMFWKKNPFVRGGLGFWGGGFLLRVGLGEWGDGGWDGMGWDGMGWLVRGGFGARLKGLGTSRALFGRPCE